MLEIGGCYNNHLRAKSFTRVPWLHEILGDCSLANYLLVTLPHSHSFPFIQSQSPLQPESYKWNRVMIQTIRNSLYERRSELASQVSLWNLTESCTEALLKLKKLKLSVEEGVVEGCSSAGIHGFVMRPRIVMPKVGANILSYWMLTIMLIW